jgi:hypothetical protein
MAQSHFPRERIAIYAALFIHVSFFILSLLYAPKTDSDAAYGIQVWRSMERGSSWNRVTEPDPTDIAKDTQQFLTWWSPGQYLVVGPLHRLGLNWGRAISIAALLCAAIGAAGFLRLYLRLGFSSETSAWSSAALLVTWHVMRNYGEFSGGELPLFALLPWLILAVLAVRPFGFISILTVALIYVCGALVKLSFCVTAVAVLAAICCSEMRLGLSFSRLWRVVVSAGCAIAVGQFALWWVFLRFGTDPSVAGHRTLPIGFILAALAALPLGSVYGVMGVLSRLLLFPGHAVLEQPSEMAPFLWLLSLGFGYIGFKIARSTSLPRGYGIFVVGMVGAYALVMGILMFRGASISLEDRLFFPPSALCLPALVEMARKGTERAWRCSAAVLLSVSCAYGIFSACVHASQLRTKANVGRSGITQHIISREALGLLHRLDDGAKRPNDAIIYLPSPEIALELSHVRCINTFDHSLSADKLRTIKRYGTVPLLVVLSDPILESEGRTSIVLNNFCDYKPDLWRIRTEGEWTFYYQGTWPSGVD